MKKQNSVLSRAQKALAKKAGFTALPTCLQVITFNAGALGSFKEWRGLSGKLKGEFPFRVQRVLLQDLTGGPFISDLEALRRQVVLKGGKAKSVKPAVPVNLVVDHSVQVDVSGTATALSYNIALELERNAPRFRFMKWGSAVFEGLSIIPPGIGICHQVNLELLAPMYHEKDGNVYLDTCVGTDSHTTMINGLGVVGWGVGGIEAEEGMLGEPLMCEIPEVIGVNITGTLPVGATATDVVLRVTEMLRKKKVVGKFVEFRGPGATAMSVPDRATIANMAPEYGATMGYFGFDGKTMDYLRMTGRQPERVAKFETILRDHGMWGLEREGVVYTDEVELDLSTIKPCVAGPKRPQDRIDLEMLPATWNRVLLGGAPDGYGKDGSKPEYTVTVNSKGGVTDTITHGSVLIAAITSCTNTSNPSVMLAAGLLAQKANARGLKVNPSVKTSLGPGSRVVTAYLEATGLQAELDKLGFQTVGYGCTTCIGNSGPLDPGIESVVKANDVVAASVLSGNRNFEARVHQSIKANFLMSPPLVVAFAIAGNVDKDLTTEPLGEGSDGQPVFLKDIWPSEEEITAAMASITPEMFAQQYANAAEGPSEWRSIAAPEDEVYDYPEGDTYVLPMPFLDNMPTEAPGVPTEIKGLRPLAIFGDSITTDHISPASAIKKESPAGEWLTENGVKPQDFNTLGARRCNPFVMTRATFGNVRIKNAMMKGKEGGFTIHQPSGEEVTIFEAAQRYQAAGVGTIVIGGEEYGTGSSRDWAAKGTNLLGVKAVVVKTFERIHRQNLCGMGVLPFEFADGHDATTLSLDGTETYEIIGLETLTPKMQATMVIQRADGTKTQVPIVLRADTAGEVEKLQHGGVLPKTARRILAEA